MKCSSLEKDKKIEGKIIKDAKNLLRVKKKKTDDTAVKDVRNLFRLKQ